MGPVREYIRQRRSMGGAKGGRRRAEDMEAKDVRGIRTDDFFGRARAKAEMEGLDEVVDDEVVNVADGGRRIHTTDSSAEEGDESSEGTQSGEERFREAESLRR
jgi:hypothetical protein